MLLRKRVLVKKKKQNKTIPRIYYWKASAQHNGSHERYCPKGYVWQTRKIES